MIRGAHGEAAVIPGSPADKAGIVEHDILLEINAKKIGPDVDLFQEIQAHAIGESLTFKVLRGDRLRTIQIILAERPNL